ncbi:MAG: ABC transporter permease, partial [Myxococcota bacterium]
MSDLGDAFATALRLLVTWNPELAEIVWLSLQVSAAALVLAAVVGLPLGAWIGIATFPGRRG